MSDHFTIVPRQGGHDTMDATFIVRADSAEHAAQIGARRLYGRSQRLQTIRGTGDPGHSGVFGTYTPLPKAEALTLLGTFRVLNYRRPR